ncbi:MAG: hypothetical protein M3362_16950 [Acidobacteriota bacterium]|nr:hypothetical protein [Acidobacteriota bacterium]
MDVPLQTADISAQGLILVPPSEPAFEEMWLNLLRAQPNAYALRNLPADLLRAARPYSVFLKNSSERPLVAYQLIWEVTDSLGVTRAGPSSYSNPGAFMGHADHPATLSTGCAIAPGKSRFFSLVSEVNDLPGDGRDEGYGYSYGSHRAIEKRKGEEPWEYPEEIESLDVDPLTKQYFAQLAGYRGITVKLDGAFLADGTFFGADEARFFDQIKALVAAKRDILNEVKAGLERGLSSAEILAPLEALADGPRIQIEPRINPADYYSFYRQNSATELLRMRAIAGDEQRCQAALRMYTQDLQKPWVALHKGEVQGE